MHMPIAQSSPAPQSESVVQAQLIGSQLPSGTQSPIAQSSRGPQSESAVHAHVIPVHPPGMQVPITQTSPASHGDIGSQPVPYEHTPASQRAPGPHSASLIQLHGGGGSVQLPASQDSPIGQSLSVMHAVPTVTTHRPAWQTW